MEKYLTNIKDLVIQALTDGSEIKTKAESGDASSCFQMGMIHLLGIDTPIDFKKASDYSSKGYQLTLNEWYGEGNVPEYLNGTSYVSDYLVEVYVVGGDFGPALKGSTFASSLDLDGDSLDNKGDVLTKFNLEEIPYKRFASDIVY